MLAQSLLDYGSIASFTAAMRSMGEAALNGLSDVSRQTWLGLGVAVLLLFMYLSRRRSRRH